MDLPYPFSLVRSGSSVRPSNNVIDEPTYAVGLNPVRRIPSVQTAYPIGVNDAADSPGQSRCSSQRGNLGLDEPDPRMVGACIGLGACAVLNRVRLFDDLALSLLEL